jgi:uncharacterized membrane protein
MTVAFDIVMRVTHIVAAVIVVGGLAFVPMLVRPVARRFDAATADQITSLIEARLRNWLWLGVVGLLLSGGYNWIGNAGIYKAMGPIGNILIGVKFLLAAIAFALLYVRQTRMLGPRADRPLTMLIVHLAAIVLILASVLRHLRLEHLASANI